MPKHSANEQYLLELINRERAKAGVQPLAFDNDLSEAAEGHSKWMLAADVFSHTGSGGSSATQRMKDAGYVLQGSWATGENIAWATTRTPSGYQDEVKLLHTNLMNSSGHRANLLNPNYREVGLGVEVGDYKGRSSAFVTQDFAKTGSDLFLTGVAFDDRDGDRFYDVGEGLGSITVTAKNSAGQVFKTTTSAAGGYDLVLKPGTYTVTFSGTDIATSTKKATIGTKNVKVDLVDPAMKAAALSANATADTLAPSSDDANAPVAENGNHRVVALDEDQLHFHPSTRLAGAADDIAHVFEGAFANLRYSDAVASRFMDHSTNFHLRTDVVDAATDGLAKILAQMATDPGHLNADLIL